MPDRVVRWFVAGKPEPQGSTRAFVVKGRAVTTSDNPKLHDWRTVLAMSSREHFAELVPVAVCVHMTFVLPRTKAMKEKPAPRHISKPDADKLARGGLDAMTGVVFRDDSMVDILAVHKRYAEPNEQPGVHVTVQWEVPV